MHLNPFRSRREIFRGGDEIDSGQVGHEDSKTRVSIHLKPEQVSLEQTRSNLKTNVARARRSHTLSRNRVRPANVGQIACRRDLTNEGISGLAPALLLHPFLATLHFGRLSISSCALSSITLTGVQANDVWPPTDRSVMETRLPASNLQTGGKPTNVRWEMFALACGTSWFLYLHRYTWNIVGAKLMAEHGFSKTQLGAIFTFFSPTYGFGQIPSGVLCDFIGPHVFLGIIIILWSLVLPCIGIPGGFTGLASVRLLFGATQSGAYPSLSKVTHAWFPAKSRTIVQGWIATFFGRGGGAMSSIILGYVLMEKCGLSWQWSLVWMGMAGLVFGVLFLVFFRNSPEEHPRVNRAEIDLINEGRTPAKSTDARVLPWRRVVRNRSMLFFVIQQILSAGADGVYVLYMGDYFLNAKGFEIGKAGLLVSLPLWGGAIGGMLGGYCNDWLIRWTGSRRWSRSSVGFTGKTLACILMFVVISQDDGVAAAWALFAVKFFSDWSQPTVWGTCTDLGGRYSASVFGVINTSGTIGGLVSPVLFGMILDYNTTNKVTNYTPLFVVISGMYLASAVCWWFIDSTTNLEADLEPVETDGDKTTV